MLARLQYHFNRSEFGKWYLQKRFTSRALAFYQQFIKPGDVVIDVGANRGNRAKIFLDLKAFTVMVEPQGSCITHLKKMFEKRPGWALVEAALGENEGEVEMLINADDTLSTLSNEWVSAVTKSRRFGGKQWDGVQKTRVTTLDKVIQEFGDPAFIKIDVEGFEKNVLSGLTIPPKAISFEFTPEYIQNTIDCVNHLMRLSNYQFQISLGESMQFHLDDWLSGNALKEYIDPNRSSLNRHWFGDIYARRLSSI